MAGFDRLTDEEVRLVRARARGEYVVDCALDWIARFHRRMQPSLISDLGTRIRSVSAALQGRSVQAMDRQVAELLDTQARARLPHGPTWGPTALPPSPELRVHAEWSPSDYFQPDVHSHRPTSRVRGPVFISYARSDADWLKRLITHLRPLERSGRLDLWHDGKLRVGENWRLRLQAAVDSASVAVLLLTANFMASDFIYTNELQPIVRRARGDGVVVVPLVVGHCLADEDDQLGEFQFFNDPELPLARLDSHEVDRVLVRLARAVCHLCDT